jgi:hypothetical protein
MLLALRIDPLKLADRIQRAGIQQPQAIEISRAVVETLAETSPEPELLTRADIHELESKIDKLAAEVTAKISALDTRIGTLDAKTGTLETKIADAKDSILRWMFGMMIALGGLIFAGLKYH